MAVILQFLYVCLPACLPTPEHHLELSQRLMPPSYIYMGDVIWSQRIVQMGSIAC